MDKKLLAVIFLIVIASGSISPVFAYTIIPPTNAYTRIITSNGTVKALNYSSVIHLQGLGSTTITSGSNSYVYITTSAGSGTGTYNQTLANNVVINSGGSKINFINGTGNPIHVINSGNKVNVTISSSSNGTGAIFDSIVCSANNFINAYNNVTHLANCALPTATGVTSLNFTTNGDFDFRFIPKNMSFVQLIGQVFTFQMKNNVVLTNESAQTITKQLTVNQLVLGGDQNVGSNSLTNSGHKSTLPSTSGTLCQTNQTGSCGTSSLTINGLSRSSFTNVMNSTNAAGHGIIINGNNRTTFSGISANSTAPVHAVNAGTGISVNGTTGTVIVTNTLTAAPKVVINGNNRSSFSSVANLTTSNRWTANNDFGINTLDKFDDAGIIIRNPSTTFATTITNGAQIANNTLNIPVFSGTSTIQLAPFYNFTSKNQTTGTTSKGTQVMYGGGIIFIPRTGTNATVSVSFITQNPTAGDGCKVDIRWGTGSFPGTNTVLTGTLVGQNMKSTVPTTASLPQSQGKTVLITGLTAGTKYFADLSYSATTGGTCNVYNVDWYAMAP